MTRPGRVVVLLMVWLSRALPTACSNVIILPLIPHEHQVARRSARRSLEKQSLHQDLPDDSQIDPLYQGLGTHYVDLWVGCPPQRQTLIVDTGSGVTAFPCRGCHHCGGAAETGDDLHPDDNHHNHVDWLFHQDESSCFRYVACSDSSCRFGSCSSSGFASIIISGGGSDPPPFTNETDLCLMSMAYAEGSTWSAVESVDRAYMGGSHFEIDEMEEKSKSFELDFGCQTSVTGMFETQLADGIVGMMMVDSAYWKQLYDAKMIDKQQFSLCFTRAKGITYGGMDSGAGALVFGGSDARLHETPMVYAKVPSREDIFDVTIKQLHLRMHGGPSIVETTTGKDKVVWQTVSEHVDESTLVDSGSTNSYLPGILKNSFEEAWKELTGMEYARGKEYSFENGTDLDDVLPTVILSLEAWKGDGSTDDVVQVAFPPSHYMRYSSRTDTYVPKLLFRSFGGTSLGANFLRGKDTLFDVDNHRLGFAESHCNYLSMGYDRFNHTLEAYDTAYERGEGEDEDTDPSPSDTSGHEGHEPTPAEPGPSRVSGSDGFETASDDETPLSRFAVALIVAGLLAGGFVMTRYRKTRYGALEEDERIAFGMDDDFDGSELELT